MEYKKDHPLHHASESEKFHFEVNHAILKAKRDEAKFNHGHHEFLTRRFVPSFDEDQRRKDFESRQIESWQY